MLIPLGYLVQKYKLKIRGVLHIGAHYGEEHVDYLSNGVKDIAYVEPCAAAFEVLKHKFARDWPWVRLYNYAAGCEYIEGANMFTASFNKGESNSLLKPKLHLQQHPEVVFDAMEPVDVAPLDDTMIFDFDRDTYNFMNVDVQGFEGDVFKGAPKTLTFIDYIYTEVNKDETYEGNMLIDDIDKLLANFTRVETKWAGNTSWGDSFYIRKTLIPPPIVPDKSEFTTKES